MLPNTQEAHAPATREKSHQEQTYIFKSKEEEIVPRQANEFSVGFYYIAKT